MTQLKRQWPQPHLQDCCEQLTKVKSLGEDDAALIYEVLFQKVVQVANLGEAWWRGYNVV